VGGVGRDTEISPIEEAGKIKTRRGKEGGRKGGREGRRGIPDEDVAGGGDGQVEAHAQVDDDAALGPLVV
jgi:hypothetical protein